MAPSPATVRNGKYPIHRVLHFFTKGEPTGLAKAYVDFVLSSAVQRDAVAEAGFLPIKENQ